MRILRGLVLPAAVAIALGLGLLSGPPPRVNAASATRNVSVNGKDTGDCTTTLCKTIGYAISQASAGDTIHVGPGIYAESVSVTMKLDLESFGATIDATGHANGVLIKGDSASGSTVANFTVEHASMEGILAQNTSGLSIHNNIVQNNDLGAQASPLVGECAPQGEVPGDCGEAIHLWAVTNSTVKQNLVSNNVGGILLTDETGPTSGNTITQNKVTSTGADCGIVLASHSLHIGSPVDPSMGGVFNNTVTDNSVVDSGPAGAGVGLFAAPPGASTYNNTVSGNTLSGNGIPGVAIHSHAPFQNVNGNVITNNVISKNGADADAASGGPTGISVFADVASGATPIKSETISGNRIFDETIGIFMKGVAAPIDVSNNSIEGSVTTPVSVTTAAGGASSGAPGGAIQPPNTGDAGLAATNAGEPSFELLALLGGLLALGFVGAMRVRRN